MQVEFVGQGAQDGGNRAANTSRLVNFYREPVNGSETAFSLRSVLGQEAFASLYGEPRAVHVLDGTIYAVAGGDLTSISAGGTVTELAAVTDGTTASMTSVLNDIVVVSGGAYRVWDGSGFLAPATGNFSRFGSLDYLKGYVVYTELDGRKWGWSDILDPKTLPALNFATAEARDDNCIRVMAVNNNAWLFKERSIEVWYPTGQPGASAFFPLGGGVTDIGLKSHDLIAKFPGGAFFIGHDNVAYVTIEASVKGVSDQMPGVSYSLANESPQACFYYEDGAHKFCVITFADRPAWCLDIATGEWHERAEGVSGPWSAAFAVDNGGWHTIHNDGAVRRMVRNGSDVDGPLIRRAQSKSLYMGRRFRVGRLEVFGRTGWADLDGVGGDPRDAQVWLRVSRDRGHNWSREIWRSLGAYGEYDRKVIWRALGQFDVMTAELGCSEPYDVTFNATATLEVA